jgi:tRNA threonylcarbamoyladenosine biosynthesis protein TsaB
MLILGLETTGEVCSVAIRDERGTAEERRFRHGRRLSERLIGLVDGLLLEAGLRLEQVEGFAVGVGPGSFTGLRVGVMTAKTWAELFDRPIVGVSSLEAVARPFAWHPGPVLPLVRARPGWVYCARFQSGRELQPVAIARVEELSERLREPGQDTPTLLCGPGVALCLADLSSTSDGLIGPADDPTASVIAEIGWERIMAGQRDDPMGLAPLYVSPPPIGPPPAAGQQAAHP